MKVEIINDGLVNVNEAAEFLGISRSKVYQLMETGDLCYCKIGRSRRIPRLALKEFAAKTIVMRDTEVEPAIS